jgi:sugar phosphate isomerase/epimerase
MTPLNRRRFLQASAAAGAASLLAEPPTRPAEKPLRLGMLVAVEDNADAPLRLAHDLGFPTCQILTENLSDPMVTGIKNAVEKYGLEVTTLYSQGPEPHVYNFYDGPLTVGVVPLKYRRQRIDFFKRASDFARKLGVPAFHTHFGFIPEDPNAPVYAGAVEALRELARHIKANGQMMLYEGGHETPIALLRMIQDVGFDNQFVNLDTGNIIIYDKGNPLDALEVIGRLVRGVHAKDAVFPTDPKIVGKEVPIGQGKADLAKVIPRLIDLGYNGPLTIEREISGPQQIEDIKKEKVYLESVLEKV